MKQTDGASATNAGGASAFVPSPGNAPNAGGTLEEKIRLTTMAQLNPALSANRQALPDPTVHTAGALPENSAVKPVEERIIKEVTERLAEQSHIRVHYYVKIVVSVFLCALLLAFGIPVFMASRMTGACPIRRLVRCL